MTSDRGQIDPDGGPFIGSPDREVITILVVIAATTHRSAVPSDGIVRDERTVEVDAKGARHAGHDPKTQGLHPAQVVVTRAQIGGKSETGGATSNGGATGNGGTKATGGDGSGG